jgi:beta-glucanase (GH16 family)
MIRFAFSTFHLLGAVALLSAMATAQPPAAPASSAPGNPWHLIWADEFNGPNGSSVDSSKWQIVTGGNGWFHHELEYYTARSQNIRQQDGNLVIQARAELYTGPDGVTTSLTSGRMQTEGKFEVKYGRIEARIKLPLGKGYWPAFWMLGNDHQTNHWPACGEIDIMENIGKPDRIYSTLHGPGYSGGKGIQAHFDLPAGQAVNTGFHLYAAEWSPNAISFFVDDHLFATQTRASLPPGAPWVFDHPFYLLLNLAIGGPWPGYPDQTTTFPQSMLVDYVRVYSR